MIAFFREMSLQTRKRLFCLFLIAVMLLSTYALITSIGDINKEIAKKMIDAGVRKMTFGQNFSNKLNLITWSSVILLCISSFSITDTLVRLWFGNPKIKELEREISELKVERSKMIINNRKSLNNQN